MAEVASSQEKLLEWGHKLEEEALRVKDAEENIRSKHNEMVQKLQASHDATVESLQAQFHKAEEARKSAQDAASKAIEEAKQIALEQNSPDAAEVLETQRVEHAAALAAVAAELDSATAAYSSSSEAMNKQNADLKSLKDQLETANADIVSTKSAMAALQASQEVAIQEHNTTIAAQTEKHFRIVEELKKTLGDDRDATLAALRSEHLKNIEDRQAESASWTEKELHELEEKHKSAKASLEARLQEYVASQETLKASMEQQSGTEEESARKALQLEATVTDLRENAEKDKALYLVSEENISHLTAALNDTKAELISAREQIDTISMEHKVLLAKALADAKALDEAKDELVKTKQEVESLQKMMDAVDQESKVKDDMHNKIKLELAAANKGLGEKTKDITVLQEKHRKELESVSTDYQTEIDALQGNLGIKEKYEELEVKHSEIARAHDEAANNYTQTLENLKKV